MTGSDYINSLPKARIIAGSAINDYFKKFHKGGSDFRWIQTTLQYPAFQHLCFGFKNQVYSIILALVDPDGRIAVDPRFVENQKRECRKNRMVACMILIKGDSVVSLFPTAPFPLTSTYYLDGMEDIDVSPGAMDLDTKMELSEWEVSSIGVQVVRDSVVKEGASILSYSDIVDISPNLWFEKDGKKSMVFIKTKGNGYSVNYEPIRLDKQRKRQFSQYGCYSAEIEIRSASGNHLFRGEPFFVKYTGLERVDIDSVE